MSVFVGACCLIYPSLGAELVATYSAVALVCTAAMYHGGNGRGRWRFQEEKVAFKKNRKVKSFI